MKKLFNKLVFLSRTHCLFLGPAIIGIVSIIAFGAVCTIPPICDAAIRQAEKDKANRSWSKDSEDHLKENEVNEGLYLQTPILL